MHCEDRVVREYSNVRRDPGFGRSSRRRTLWSSSMRTHRGGPKARTIGRGFFELHERARRRPAATAWGSGLRSVISSDRQANWEQDGWCVLESFLPADTVAAAQAGLPSLFPTAEEFAADADPARNAPFRNDSHRVMPRFPFQNAALNELVVHDSVIDLAEQLLGLGSADLRMYQAMLEREVLRGCRERRPAPPRRFRKPHARRAAGTSPDTSSWRCSST